MQSDYSALWRCFGLLKTLTIMVHQFFGIHTDANTTAHVKSGGLTVVA